MGFLVATTSLPAVYRPNGYARTATPEQRPLERRTLVPKVIHSATIHNYGNSMVKVKPTTSKTS